MLAFDKEGFIKNAMSKPSMSWDEIKVKYPDHFLILYDYTISSGIIDTGRVIGASDDIAEYKRVMVSCIKNSMDCMYVYTGSDINKSRDESGMLLCLTYIDNPKRMSWKEIEETYPESNVVVTDQEGDCVPPKYAKVFAAAGYGSNAGLVEISLDKSGIECNSFGISDWPF